MPDLLAQPQVGEALRDAVTEVLQKMFFIRILDDPDPSTLSHGGRRAPPGNEIGAWVDFHGDPSGALLLRLDRSVARTVAADFLGEEEREVGERQVEEVTAELANMVCGAVLSHIESSASFRLDTPRTVDPRADDGRVETARHVFPIGGGELTVKIWMEDPVCSPSGRSAS
jgi:CheY-specific phosphatase CheX